MLIRYTTLIDIENGPSTCAAWSGIYTVIFASQAFKSRHIVPIATLAAVASNGAIYLKETVDGLDLLE